MAISFIIVWIIIVIFVLIKYQSVWRKRHQALIKYFNGEIALDGSSVDFYWQGVKFSAARAGSGSGIGGTGSYGTLDLYLNYSEKFVISLDYLKRIEIKASEEIKQKLLDAISSDKDLESRLRKSLSVENSIILCQSRTDIDRDTLLKQTHLLSICGLAVPYLEEPKSLESELETLILLSKTFNLTPKK